MYGASDESVTRAALMSWFLQFGMTAVLLLAAITADLPPGSKIVFLKGKELVSANADGSEQRVLIRDGVAKERPKWSPDGMKIAFTTPPVSPKALAVINVVTGDGKQINQVPVLTELPDGTVVEGMSSVDDSGWFGNSAVYVEGTENPHYGEYRVFDVASAKMIALYGGYGFASCPSQGKVAYVNDPDSDSPTELHVQANGKDLIVVPANQEPRYFAWSTDCERLAYMVGSDAQAKMVILRNQTVEAMVPVGTGFDGANIRAVGGGFLLDEAMKTEFYDVKRKVLVSDLLSLPPGTASVPQVTAEAVAERLGGSAASVWSPK
jgi:hypothetical protein